MAYKSSPVARDAWRLLRSIGVNSLLADPSDNPKLEKSLGLRVYSAPLHLAPANLSGHEVCPMATNGCRAACLHTAGNPAYLQNKNRARIARTRAYFSHRAAFMTALCDDIAKHVDAAKQRGMLPAVRLNATSDIPWESVGCVDPSTSTQFPNVMALFPHVTFYDYTKRHNRKRLPVNYSLTFSLAENNATQAQHALMRGMNVAAVFAVKPGHALPPYYTLNGARVPVIDGDTHDFRPIDPAPVIVGLRAKGKARADVSGFVIRDF